MVFLDAIKLQAMTIIGPSIAAPQHHNPDTIISLDLNAIRTNPKANQTIEQTNTMNTNTTGVVAGPHIQKVQTKV